MVPSETCHLLPLSTRVLASRTMGSTDACLLRAYTHDVSALQRATARSAHRAVTERRACPGRVVPWTLDKSKARDGYHVVEGAGRVALACHPTDCTLHMRSFGLRVPSHRRIPSSCLSHLPL
eukprot:6418887-Prymnesium_polylepis.2